MLQQHFFIYNCIFGFVVAATSLLLRYWRLRHVPGPLICKFTDLYRVYIQRRGQILSWLLQLHEKYGTVVRIGVNTVSVSDPKTVPEIYTSHGEFRKADSYQSLRSWSEGVSKGSMIDMQDEKLVTATKKSLRGAFSAKNVLDYESDVDDAIVALQTRLRKDSNSISIFDVLQQFQIDFLMKAAFSQSPHFLESGADTKMFSFQDRFFHWQSWQGMPWLEHLIFQTRLGNLLRRHTRPAWAVMAGETIQKRSACEKREGKKLDLLDKYIEAGKAHPDLLDQEALLRMVSSTISAGFDTTAYTMANMLFYLCKNPDAFGKLKKEIMDVQEKGALSEVPKWTEVNKLTYLDAVLKEAMRMKPFLNLPLERVAPSGGVVINGIHLPENSVIGSHPAVLSHSKAYYGEDADEFRPERWLTGDRVAMERHALVFGNGKRICLGRHIAEMEIKKTIPAILRGFEVKLLDQDMVYGLDDGLTSFPSKIMARFEATDFV